MGRRAERSRRRVIVPALVLVAAAGAARAEPARHRSLSPRVVEAADAGRASPGARRHVVVGLALRDPAGLESMLAALQDPSSSSYHRFLTPDQFDATYAPTVEAETSVVAMLETAGLHVTERFPNRLVVGAVGTVAAIERAFGSALHTVVVDGAPHLAALAEPALPPSIAGAVVGVVGLDDLTRARPHVRVLRRARPDAALGRNCCHLSPADLLAFYDDPATAGGAGETIVVAGVFRWKDADLAVFDATWGLPSLGPDSDQVCTGSIRARGCRFDAKRSIEAALDVEYAHGIAPAARVRNYMAASPSLVDLTLAYERIVSDDAGHVVLSSWGACEADVADATQEIDDQIFANAAALGQTWFVASGDEGSRDCRHGARERRVVSVDHPANSPHVTAVGGTTPVCSAGLTPDAPACAGYGGETAWRGSGGGVSTLFARPAFQTACGLPAGSTRLVPDVALAADPGVGTYVRQNGHWFTIGGTSSAVSPWAGVFATLDQQRGGGGLGQAAPRLYALCATPVLHDVTAGANDDYAAGPGYDLVTGLGTMAARALLDAY